MKVSLFIPFAMTLSFALAELNAARAETVAEIRSELVGAKGRTWSEGKIIRYKSVKRQCSGGKAYQFTPNQQLKTETCEGGKLSVSTEPLRLLQRSSLDVDVTIGTQRYTVGIGQENGTRVLRLRNSVTDKSGKTEEITLKLEREG